MAEGTRQKSIVLILARELASKLATAMFIVDPDGRLIFYNEPAERVLGRTFAESGELTASEWSGALYNPQDLDGTSLPPERLPLVITLNRQEPAHRTFYVTGLDGERRLIAVTSFPLFARAEEFVGAVAIFWEEAIQEGG